MVYGKKEAPWVPPAMKPLTMTVDEACARVDNWNAEQQFDLHVIARVLREEVRRLHDYKAIDGVRAYEEYCAIMHSLAEKSSG